MKCLFHYRNLLFMCTTLQFNFSVVFWLFLIRIYIYKWGCFFINVTNMGRFMSNINKNEIWKIKRFYLYIKYQSLFNDFIYYVLYCLSNLSHNVSSSLTKVITSLGRTWHHPPVEPFSHLKSFTPSLFS